MKQTLRNLLLLLSLLIGVGGQLTACALSSPKPEVLYRRPGAKINSVVVMPVTDFSGEKSAAARQIEDAVADGWARTFGETKVHSAGPVVEELNIQLASGYEKIIDSIKAPARVTHLKSDPGFARYVSMFSSEVGNHDLAFAVVDGEREQFEKQKPVYLYLGVFDIKTMSWKWITRTQGRKGLFAPWETASVDLVSDGFEATPRLEKTRVSHKSGEVNSKRR